MFEQHESGQLRIGAGGDQLSALPLPDALIPASDGPALTSPALEELAGRYAVLCDECKTELRRTDSVGESAAGGLCQECRTNPEVVGAARAQLEREKAAGLDGLTEATSEPMPPGWFRPDGSPWSTVGEQSAAVTAAAEKGRTRARLEARAERRRQWAGSRSAKSDAAHAAAHELADRIPMGQPILVGHHSEGRHRRDVARIENNMRAAVDHGRMAEEHESNAAGLESQLRGSVYDDDPDAVEQLRRKVERLEAKRAEIKARPHEGWELSNLGATIRQAKQRIERLEREQATRDAGGRGRGRPMLARFSSLCAECGDPIEKGSPIVYYRLVREAVHEGCDGK